MRGTQVMYTCVQTMYKKRCEWRSGGVSGGVRGRSGGVRGTQVMYMYVQTVCTIKKRSEGEEWRSEGKEWRSEGDAGDVYVCTNCMYN